MRIVAGSARGRRLLAPRGRGTRPTSDKVRGAVFNVLGQFFEGGAVLDLYAGTGALALEALSRGCERAVCVDDDRAAAVAIRRNAEACGFAERVEIRREPVEAALGRLPRATFALAFLDPPYALGPEMALPGLAPVLAPGGLAMAEHDARRPPASRYGALALADRREYGDTGISIYRLE
ncbi:MAG: 16S rRNA (guanine(966)-N(2))-methyltransferase RsmD [Anaeromyxobacter sp. RBG_16_69_14]|nr:MAG: 16S rRNA (guanine(966)-N(2))-methyltransferase RsmD [Anaeromyxobacter sp. RBG_16_69_14]